ncbi:MAG: exopolysaccharide biosynthesis polyprenyl glycosylphosphotransferase [Nitriliruptor sp.]
MSEPSAPDSAERDQLPVLDPTAEEPLLRRLNERGFRLVMLLDAFVLVAIMLGSMFWRFGTSWQNYPTWLFLFSFTVALFAFVASLYLGGMYEREPRLGAPNSLPRAVRQMLVAGGMLELANLAATGAARVWLDFGGQRVLPFPFQNLVTTIVLGSMAVAVNRWLVHRLRTRREGPPKVILVGTPAALDVARDHLGSDPLRVEVVGTVEDPADLVGAVLAADATDVMVIDNVQLEALYPGVLTQLDAAGVTVLLRVTARETMLRLNRIREVGGLPFVRLFAQTMPRSRAQLKRLVDLGLLVVGVPLWAPLLAVVALHQLVVAGRPLLYWQERVGAHGRPFRMVKFRTMRTDAELDGQARLADRDDDRVIPACRWVRSSRMDELPQLWNVARGEMSLVGPRPERPELTVGFAGRIAGYERRHEVPPGLTGLAQVHGRYHTDPEYKLGYDLQYLVNWSPILDLEILLRTVWVVVARRI